MKGKLRAEAAAEDGDNHEDVLAERAGVCKQLRMAMLQKTMLQPTRGMTAQQAMLPALTLLVQMGQTLAVVRVPVLTPCVPRCSLS